MKHRISPPECNCYKNDNYCQCDKLNRLASTMIVVVQFKSNETRYNMQQDNMRDKYKCRNRKELSYRLRGIIIMLWPFMDPSPVNDCKQDDTQ